VAKNEELAGRTHFSGPPGDAQMIAAMFLRETFYANISLTPFFSDDVATAIRGCFFEARRFGDDEIAECCEHLWQTGLQHFQKHSGEIRFRHGRDMLAAQVTRGNRAKIQALRGCHRGRKQGNSRDNARG